MKFMLVLLGAFIAATMLLDVVYFGTFLLTGQKDFGHLGYDIISIIISYKWIGTIVSHYLPDFDKA